MNKCKLIIIALIYFILMEIPLVHSQLIAHYSFDGDSDDEISGSKGVISGATLISNRFSNSNKAYYFNGNSSITYSTNTSIEGLDNSMSVSVWIKPENFDNQWQTIISKGATSIKETFSLFLRSDNHLEWVNTYKTEANGYDRLYFITEDPVIENIDEWYHIVATFAGSNVKVFVNGAMVMNQVLNISEVLYPNDSDIIVGYRDFEETAFIGSIDDVRIYNKELSESDVITLYEMTDPVTDAIDEEETVISCYPNPTDGIIHLNNAYSNKVKICNTSGLVVFEAKIESEDYIMNLNELGTKGLYLIQFINSDEQIIENKRVLFN